MGNTQLTDPRTIHEIVLAYALGESVDSIGSRYHVTKRRISDLLRSEGVQVRPERPPAPFCPGEPTLEEEAEVERRKSGIRAVRELMDVLRSANKSTREAGIRSYEVRGVRGRPAFFVR